MRLLCNVYLWKVSIKYFVFIITSLSFSFSQVDSPSVLINEFLAGSDTCCGTDIFDGNAEDFVELYNYGTDTINISGWGFSDTDGLITTTAPDTSIAPSDFLVLWYTGDNNGFPEVNEKLSKNGETIYIADANGSPIASYNFGAQTDDLSYGRNPDGYDSWVHMSPTPGQSNITNSAPEDFSLTFPLVSDTLTASLVNQGDSLVFIDNTHFYWEQSNDPDQNNVHYIFSLYIQCCDGIDLWRIADTLDNNNNSISNSYFFNILSEIVDGPIFSVPHEIHWSVKAIDGTDESSEVSNLFYVVFNDYLEVQHRSMPESFKVFSAYPNPFNPITFLRYNLPNDGLVNIAIYDMMGRIVKTLVNGSQTAGFKTTRWNATNDRNEPAAAGLYLYTIQAGEFRQTRKMVLLK